MKETITKIEKDYYRAIIQGDAAAMYRAHERLESLRRVRRAARRTAQLLRAVSR